MIIVANSEGAVHQVVPLHHHSGCKQLRPCSHFVAELQVGQDAGVVLQSLQPPSSSSHCHVLVVSGIVCVGNIDICKIVIVVVVVIVIVVVVIIIVLVPPVTVAIYF